MLLLYLGIGLFIMLAIILIIYLIKLNNNLAKLEIEVKKEYSNIDVALKKRSDLIPKLVDTIKGYMQHEQTLLTELVKIRNTSNSEKELIENDQKLTSLLNNVFLLAENYPDLKSSSNFMQLQEELGIIEEDIANSRIAYNKAVLKYNNIYMLFPTKIFARIIGFSNHEYFKVKEEDKDMPEIKF